jgi:hypothetical protein
MVEREFKEKLAACAERKERKEWNLEHIGEFTEGSILSVFSSQVNSGLTKDKFMAKCDSQIREWRCSKDCL